MGALGAKLLAGVISSWFVIGVIVAVGTGNVSMDTISSRPGFMRSLVATVLWPVPAGSGLCSTSAGDGGLTCSGWHGLGNAPYKIVPNPTKP